MILSNLINFVYIYFVVSISLPLLFKWGLAIFSQTDNMLGRRYYYNVLDFVVMGWFVASRAQLYYAPITNCAVNYPPASHLVNALCNNDNLGHSPYLDKRSYQCTTEIRHSASYRHAGVDTDCDCCTANGFGFLTGWAMSYLFRRHSECHLIGQAIRYSTLVKMTGLDCMHIMRQHAASTAVGTDNKGPK